MNDAQNDAQSKLGDFKYSGTKGSYDYTYDVNGNMVLDNNKAISSITYNHLNLPNVITVTAKGNITYTYDAAGNKISKVTLDNTVTPSLTTTTLYLGSFVYQNDTLQFINQEEGRIRWAKHKYLNGATAYGFEYDYFLKDHLGNVRMVLTQQKDTAQYVATMEAGYRATENQLFYNIPASNYSRAAVSGYPSDPTTNPNDSLMRLNGSGQKVGAAIILKVMSGDVVDIAVKAFYKDQTYSSPNNSVNDILNALANGTYSLTGGAKGTLGELNNTGASPLFAAINSFITNSNPTIPSKPRAHLNWILLDEQFQYVNSYPQSGALAVGNYASNTLNTFAYTGITITRNGFLYIYVNNETPGWDVFFDNLSVKQYTGALLEETNYYPFGLIQQGISSKAANKLENEIKFTGQQLDDDLELNWYQFRFRNMDPQIGRFLQIDPLAVDYAHNSTYAYAENDVIRAMDLEGLEKFIITAEPRIPGASVITYDPTPVKDLAGKYQVFDSRDGKTYTDAFPEQAMQKNLGGSFVNGQGNLYIQGDNNPNLKGDTWDLKDFQNPITGDNNPRDGNNSPFTLIAGESAKTPMKKENRDITDQVITLTADQDASGNFEKASGSITHDFKVPPSSSSPKVSIMTHDGGTYHNNFVVKSGGTVLTTIRESGTGNVTAPANSTLSVQVTGVPGLRADIYNINVNITTTKTVSVTTIDKDKLK